MISCFFKHKAAYEMRISDWSSDVCSSDLRRVGVSSNSHKAINNLLAKIETVAAETGLTFSGVKKCTRGNESHRLNGEFIVDAEKAGDGLDCDPALVGGTGWLFADGRMD